MFVIFLFTDDTSTQSTCVILLLVDQISDLDWRSNCIIAPENFSSRAKPSHAIVANRAQKPHTEERKRETRNR